MAVMVSILVCGGCSTKGPKAGAKPDVQFTKEITAKVADNQKIMMGGQEYPIAEVPAELEKMNASRYITIFIEPKSKMTRETLRELVQTLVSNKFYVAIDPQSKFSDAPVPRLKK
jgi:hypothetical protein